MDTILLTAIVGVGLAYLCATVFVCVCIGKLNKSRR